MRPNRLQILMVFAVGVLFGGVRGDCGGFGPDLSNLEKSGSLVVHVDDQNGVPVNGVEVQICCNREPGHNDRRGQYRCHRSDSGSRNWW